MSEYSTILFTKTPQTRTISHLSPKQTTPTVPPTNRFTLFGWPVNGWAAAPAAAGQSAADRQPHPACISRNSCLGQNLPALHQIYFNFQQASGLALAIFII
jgi:hypothetical protein